MKTCLAAALLLSVPVARGNPPQISAARLSACATGNCATIMGSLPTASTAALSVSGGKTDGGTYTPGETLTLTNTGGGQYVLYAEAAGTQLARQNGQSATVTAPTSGTLTLLGMRASAYGTVTFEKMTLTAGAGGNIGIPPPPAVLQQPPPPPAHVYTSPDGHFEVTWTAGSSGVPGATLDIAVIARPLHGSDVASTWIGFALGDHMLGSAGLNLALVGFAGSSIVGYVMKGKHLEDMEQLPEATLQRCGVLPTGQSVQLIGKVLEMRFTLLRHAGTADKTCNGAGVTLPSLSVHGVGVSNIVVAAGETQGFGHHPSGGYTMAQALSMDGTNVESHPGRGFIVLAHAGCMLVAWFIMAPIALYLPRYGRHMVHEGWWFGWHKRLMMLVTLLTLVGFVIALIMVPGSHFGPVHGKFGLTFVILLVLQPLGGLVRPMKDSPQRGAWLIVHRGLGALLACLGPAICLMGAFLTSMGAGLFAILLFFVLMGLVQIAYLEYKRYLNDGEMPVETKAVSVYSETNRNLPPGWSKHADSEGKTYYINATTGETQWHPPKGSAEEAALSRTRQASESPWSENFDQSSGTSCKCPLQRPDPEGPWPIPLFQPKPFP